MSCEDVIEETKQEVIVLETSETNEVIVEVSEIDNSENFKIVEVVENTNTIEVEEEPKIITRKKKSSYKNKNNE